MNRTCDNRVVIVTGAGGGIGRSHALAFAKAGAKVVVNDLGVQLDGQGPPSPVRAQRVVEEIVAHGGTAIAEGSDISTWDGAQKVVEAAIDGFGGLDVVVNNAGNYALQKIVESTPEVWDMTMAVHLRGAMATTHWASKYWRDRVVSGQINDARIIMTSSVAGLFPGHLAQRTAYATAKAGILAMTRVAAFELAEYGVTVNAVAPSGTTRMNAIYDASTTDEPGDLSGPAANSPLVVWLGSRNSKGVSGRVFRIRLGEVTLMRGWSSGPAAETVPLGDFETMDIEIPRLLVNGA